MYDLIILGAGPAGLSAAVYSSRYNMNFLVIGKDMGIIPEADKVDNYIGFPSISGIELANKFTEHVEKFGTKIIRETVKDLEKKDDFFVVKTEKNTYQAKTIIYALGGHKRRLGLPEEDKFAGKGISYCATCDAAFFKEKIVIVTGGSNSAVSSALYLSEFTNKVYIVYRRDKLRAFPALVKRVEENPKIELILNSNVVQIKGKNKVEAVILENSKTGEKKELAVDGIFVEFGYEPNSYLAEKIGVNIDETGRIVVKEDMSTNVKGFFAAGDVTTGSNRFNQIVTAAAEGAIAASSVYKFLKGGE